MRNITTVRVRMRNITTVRVRIRYITIERVRIINIKTVGVRDKEYDDSKREDK